MYTKISQKDTEENMQIFFEKQNTFHIFVYNIKVL